jgi:chromosome segregation ATPase
MEMAAEAKLQLSQVLTEKAGLESKVAEFNAENSSLKRQLGHSDSLQNTLLSEKERLQSKVSQLEQEVTLLKKELDISQNGSSRPLTDVSRIQAHMNSLSKKVQEQVETLLEEDEEDGEEKIKNESQMNPLSVAAKRQRAASLFSTPSNPSTPRSVSPGRRSFFIKPS